MLGMIFTEALDFIDEQVGVVGLEEILLRAGLSDGVAFTAVGNYGHEQLVDVVSAAAGFTGIPTEDLTRAFGSWLFVHLVEAHPHAQELAERGLREFLLGIHSEIHSSVISLYAAADPPAVLAEEHGGTIVVEYRSHRPFAALAQGLLEGCCEYFAGTHEVIARSASSSGGGKATFEVVPRQTAQT